VDAARIFVVERQETPKKTSANHEYRKVIADLRTCEERYQRLVESIPATDETRLKAAVATLQSEVRQRKRLEAELLRAVETERERIGQDLHDDLCQRLGATAMMTSVIAERIGHKDKASGKQLRDIANLINDTIESCRSLARGLHPITLAQKGLPAALDELAERMPVGIKFRWPQGRRISFKPETALHLYRITEEAVANAVKHAEARNVTIALDLLDGQTLLAIEDDGQGFQRNSTSDGMGLRNIEYRASVIGATLTVAQREGGGTRIECRLPGTRTRVKAGRAN
jgi:signal transduction histidine kinase